MSEVLFSLKVSVNSTTFSLNSSDTPADLSAGKDVSDEKAAQNKKVNLEQENNTPEVTLPTKSAQTQELLKAAQAYLNTLQTLEQNVGREENDQLSELARSIVNTENSSES